jgi:hypothetical protein
MYKIILFPIIILSSILFSCKKIEDPIIPEENLLIEEFTYHQDGVVFKIVYDVENAIYRIPNTADDLFAIKIDSICISKFHYYGPRNFFSEGYTWFTKKGQYVCWRYKYTSEAGGYENDKCMDLIFPNRFLEYSSEKFVVYSQFITNTYEASLNPSFQAIFPKPINDTVYVKLSRFRPDKVW